MIMVVYAMLVSNFKSVLAPAPDITWTLALHFRTPFLETTKRGMHCDLAKWSFLSFFKILSLFQYKMLIYGHFFFSLNILFRSFTFSPKIGRFYPFCLNIAFFPWDFLLYFKIWSFSKYVFEQFTFAERWNCYFQFLPSLKLLVHAHSEVNSPK